MHPTTAKLLYVGDEGNDVVDVFNYPSLSLAGQLTGFSAVYGLCANPGNGDVYVTDFGSDQILGYHHGASTPFLTLSQGTAGTPWNCAFDSANGNLAVMEYTGGLSPSPIVFIYVNATGNPVEISANTNVMTLAYFLNYDAHGDLWIGGYKGAAGNTPAYARIKHQNPLGNITSLSVQPSIAEPTAVQWADHHWALGDSTTATIWQVNQNGTTFGSTALVGWSSLSYFFIEGNKVIAADGSNNIAVFKYPAGTLFHTFPPGTFGSVAGIVISE